MEYNYTYFSELDTEKGLYEIPIWNRKTHRRLSKNKKRVYIENYNYYVHKVYHIFDYLEAISDSLALYFCCNPNNVKIFFNNENDCILWRLRYGV
jgi:hypothetical protein